MLLDDVEEFIVLVQTGNNNIILPLHYQHDTEVARIDPLRCPSADDNTKAIPRPSHKTFDF